MVFNHVQIPTTTITTIAIIIITTTIKNIFKKI